MTNGESLPKGQTKETEAKEQPQVRSLSIEEVLNQYPVDREKARDVVLMEISKNLASIANSLSTITNLKIKRAAERAEKPNPDPG